jgi:hypothetical protein
MSRNDGQIETKVFKKDGKTNLAIFLFFFCFASIVLFHFTYFHFVFTLDFCCFASMRNKRKYTFFASKRNKIFASISSFASEPKPRHTL